jgi:hypothetical protein
VREGIDIALQTTFIAPFGNDFLEVCVAEVASIDDLVGRLNRLKEFL